MRSITGLRMGRSRVPVALSAPLVAYLARVGGDGATGEVGGAGEVGRADGADVELFAETEGVGTAVEDRAGCLGEADGRADGVGEEFGGGPGGRGVLGSVRAVEPDHRMEVDGASPLVFGDLGVRDLEAVAQRRTADARAGGELLAEVGGEASPEGTGVSVPEHGGAVVVAVGFQGRAKDRVTVRVETSAAAAATARTVVDGAEGGCGEGGEDAGMFGDGRADSLAAAQAGRDEVVRVFAVDLSARGTPCGAAVVAADEELPGGKVAVDDLTDDLSRRCVDVEAVALHPYGPLAAAESLNLVCVGAQFAVQGDGREVADGSGRSLGAHVRVPPWRRKLGAAVRLVQGARQCGQVRLLSR
jgi:hypothetical protein